MLYTLDEKTFPRSTWKGVEYRSLPKTNLNDMFSEYLRLHFVYLKFLENISFTQTTTFLSSLPHYHFILSLEKCWVVIERNYYV